MLGNRKVRIGLVLAVVIAGVVGVLGFADGGKDA